MIMNGEFMKNRGDVRSTLRSVWRTALSTVSGPHTSFAPCLRANRRVGTKEVKAKSER